MYRKKLLEIAVGSVLAAALPAAYAAGDRSDPAPDDQQRTSVLAGDTAKDQDANRAQTVQTDLRDLKRDRADRRTDGRRGGLMDVACREAGDDQGRWRLRR